MVRLENLRQTDIRYRVDIDSGDADNDDEFISLTLTTITSQKAK